MIGGEVFALISMLIPFFVRVNSVEVKKVEHKGTEIVAIKTFFLCVIHKHTTRKRERESCKS